MPPFDKPERGDLVAAPAPWTPAEDHQLADLHAQGFSLSVCATRMGRSRSTVCVHSKRLGLSWDRSKTKAATQARVADNKALRSQIEAQALVEAQGFLADLHKPFLAFSFGGRDNDYNEHLLDRPPTGDVRNLMQSFNIAINQSLKIAVHDADMSANLAAVDQWLTHVTGSGTPDAG